MRQGAFRNSLGGAPSIDGTPKSRPRGRSWENGKWLHHPPEFFEEERAITRDRDAPKLLEDRGHRSAPIVLTSQSSQARS